MDKKVGIWVDHRKAVIVTITDRAAATQEISSNMEKYEGFSSSKARNIDDSQGSSAEDMRDRKFGNHLNKYYNGIVSVIRDADSIWIFGPGEAKAELENQLKKDGLGARIVGIYPADKMTTPQIIAKVQAHYN